MYLMLQKALVEAQFWPARSCVTGDDMRSSSYISSHMLLHWLHPRLNRLNLAPRHVLCGLFKVLIYVGVQAEIESMRYQCQQLQEMLNSVDHGQSALKASCLNSEMVLCR